MNKPVAWFLKYKDETYVECPSSVVGAIPLYTAEQLHPVKELTDEEITEVFRDCTKDGILDANDFARAILRKAQEK